MCKYKLTISQYCFIVLVAIVVTGVAISCDSNSHVGKRLSEAEALMESQPDSALRLLEEFEKSMLGSEAERAHYALLMSMALDKNYIDTTSFDILQPAIDYYLKKGSPDDKLRTYYYQGRIFQNKGDRDNALHSFVKGIDNSLNCADSLTLVRMLVAQAYLYYEFYDFENYTNCHLKAADICRKISHKDYEFDCLRNALNGSILLNNKNMTDSLLHICNNIEPLSRSQRQSLSWYKLSYVMKYGSEQEIENFINNNSGVIESNTIGNLNLALAYNKLGKNYRAKEILDAIKSSGIGYDTLKYQSIIVSVLKDMRRFDEALSAYEEFSHRVDSIDNLKFNQKLQLIDFKHKFELKTQEDERLKSRIIWSAIGGILILALGIIILLLFIRSGKAQKDLALQKVKNTELENKQLKSDKDVAVQRAKITELENEKLKSERENLALENKNLQLERDKKALEAENLMHRVESLENESESLKILLETSEEIPSEVQNAIRIRIEMLNSLLASYITDNDQYGRPYDNWVKELTDDTEKFMNSNRLAFQLSHPRFIQYFEDHCLSVNEINYVCLYAIGLRGKEVGNYMKKRSHVNISSAIRKKLGIDKHETNIGIYVRKLLKNL